MLKLSRLTRCFSSYSGITPFTVQQLQANKIDEYGISLYSYMSVQHNETEAINKQFMELSEQLNSDIQDNERKNIEAQLNDLRKHLGDKG